MRERQAYSPTRRAEAAGMTRESVASIPYEGPEATNLQIVKLKSATIWPGLRKANRGNRGKTNNR